MIMMKQWGCPDVGASKPEGYYNPIPGSSEAFPNCPAYYLRQAPQMLPAEHLIEGTTHPAELVGAWAFELESGSRQAESLSPKAIEGVHLWFREKRSRDLLEDELRKTKKPKPRVA